MCTECVEQFLIGKQHRRETSSANATQSDWQQNKCHFALIHTMTPFPTYEGVTQRDTFTIKSPAPHAMNHQPPYTAGLGNLQH